jgi:hypothetical protein
LYGVYAIVNSSVRVVMKKGVSAEGEIRVVGDWLRCGSGDWVVAE